MSPISASSSKTRRVVTSNRRAFYFMDSKPSVPRCTQITGERDREQARVNREWEAAKERNQNLVCAKNRGMKQTNKNGKHFSRQIEHIYRLNIQRRREDWSF